eukprot:Protomagalhaensia_sp_Gyna_25__1771@NODE_1931_length_1408_cov_3_290723_g1590_i0_p1_GENE_NODE_1931_length_1408_cov_3_290723_g1590_i0NODE_1931_length_1408_cov_3_290723_g1590_i0_p1_ORF_typecomplete_len262_score29_38_NODE_1931_length_1408_cov_3_290723_g1590_i05891374
MMLVAVEDCLNKPLSHKILLRLRNTLHRARILLDLMHELASCELLICQVRERRHAAWEFEQATRRQREQRENRGRAKESRKPHIWLKRLTYPYLYMVTLQLLFEFYPNAPDGEPWKMRAPTDARCLAGIVCKLELPGSELLLFLTEALQLLRELILSLPADGFHPPGAVLQYLLHAAFVLDAPALFHLLLCLDRDGCLRNSPFDWDGALAEMEAGEAYRCSLKGEAHQPEGKPEQPAISKGTPEPVRSTAQPPAGSRSAIP